LQDANNNYLCLSEDPGNGKLDAVLDDAMNTRINGSKNARCTSYNYWASPNAIPDLLKQSPADPRLLTMLITDFGAITSTTGRHPVPIRSIADFYVTGWQGDPCIGQANRSGTQNSNGLASTGDDDPTAISPATCDPSNKGAGLPNCDGVLLGHFVQYTELSSSGTGSGVCVQTTALGNCIGVLTK
jgi:hypothetical protein